MGSPLKCKYDFTKTFGPTVHSVFDSLICGHITFLVIGHDFREYLLKKNVFLAIKRCVHKMCSMAFTAPDATKTATLYTANDTHNYSQKKLNKAKYG